MEESFDCEVRPYLDLVDALRHVGVHQEISLPQIAVMGDQSSGKSSVLQSLSGIPFPKGTGLVTRCPTQLILTKSAKNSPWIAEVSINFKNSTKKQPAGTGYIHSIEKLTEVIELLTNTLTNGERNGFSTDIIVIKISSPDSPDLTIIDLPGIIRTVTKDQDKAVIQQVNNLIDSYMSQVNTIILAVIPANQDIATIDILERAHKVSGLIIFRLGALGTLGFGSPLGM
jgi:interferon-induced GTP-binding protein Mx1